MRYTALATSVTARNSAASSGTTGPRPMGAVVQAPADIEEDGRSASFLPASWAGGFELPYVLALAGRSGLMVPEGQG